ncbi:MAG: PEP-utilizing enzyme [Nanoarchaeota archaeon]
MNIWPKLYTREFPIILCEIWCKGYSNFFGVKPDVYPIYALVLKEGLVDAYRNPEATPHINKIFYQEKLKNKDFIKEFYELSLEKFEELEDMWEKDSLSKGQLLDFYQKTINFWDAMYASMYLPYSPELFDKEEIDLMIKLRAKIDVTGDEASQIIMKSLNKIYPKLGNLILYISIEDLEKDKFNLKILEERSKGELFMIDGKLVSKDYLKNIKKKEDFDFEEVKIDNNINEIKGQIAHKGFVKGKVKLILRRDEINSIEEGEILVSTMTIPDFLPAMKKAAAFVTDEGGITCHAAIIAREIGKPCIIGTKIATKVLRNGDLIEVDADKGIVRIIKRI